MKWICIKERKPDQDMICVVYNCKRPFQYYISTYTKYFDEFEVWMIGVTRLPEPVCFNATHWMKIESPEE